MKPLARFVGVALVGAFALLANLTAQAQVSITIGAPNWGPSVPYGTQYYYIPEIDGYYDLYSQQYIVFQDGYWVPLPQLYGYDPYQFHPVVIGYRGRQPWLQRDYYHQHYAYRPYCAYGPSRTNGYYNGGYGRPGYDNHVYGNRDNRGYDNRDHDYYDRDNRDRNDHDRDDRDNHDRDNRDRDNRGQYGGGGRNVPAQGPGGYFNNTPRGNQIQAPQQLQPGNNQGQGGDRGGFGPSRNGPGQGQQGNGRSEGHGNGGGRGRS